jgi:hypothetical protein
MKRRLRWIVATGATVAWIAVVTAPAAAVRGDSLATTAGPIATRYCGESPRMIANAVRASWNVRCSQARLLMKALLGGSNACYPHGYTSSPTCRLEGFYCSARSEPSNGTTRGRFARGRQLVTGRAGP